MSGVSSAPHSDALHSLEALDGGGLFDVCSVRAWMFQNNYILFIRSM